MTEATITLTRHQDAYAAVTAFGFVLNQIDAQRRLSITYDQGRVQTWIQEMARHKQLSEITGIGLLCRSTQPLAAWHQREHQRHAAPVFLQGHGPFWIHSRPTRCRRLATQHATLARASASDVLPNCLCPSRRTRDFFKASSTCCTLNLKPPSKTLCT